MAARIVRSPPSSRVSARTPAPSLLSPTYLVSQDERRVSHEGMVLDGLRPLHDLHPEYLAPALPLEVLSRAPKVLRVLQAHVVPRAVVAKHIVFFRSNEADLAHVEGHRGAREGSDVVLLAHVVHEEVALRPGLPRSPFSSSLHPLVGHDRFQVLFPAEHLPSKSSKSSSCLDNGDEHGAEQGCVRRWGVDQGWPEAAWSVLRPPVRALHAAPPT